MYFSPGQAVLLVIKLEVERQEYTDIPDGEYPLVLGEPLTGDSSNTICAIFQHPTFSHVSFVWYFDRRTGLRNPVGDPYSIKIVPK